MRLSRSSLCGILLEGGEEDLAVIIARADLPDVLDTESDGPALAALGLSEEDLRSLLPAVSGDPADANADMAGRAQTISARWAHLVSIWTAND
jgi:hypothetical protein